MSDETHVSALLTLAILKVNHDKQNRYIDTFIPFVIDAIRINPSSNIETVQSCILEKYKLKIPLNSLKTLLIRAERKKIISSIKGYYEISDKSYDNTNYDLARNNALREQKQLVQNFLEFCNTHYGRKFSESEGESAIFNYIRHRDVELLRSTVFGAPFRDDSKISKEITFYVGQFVTYISTNDQQLFELLHSYIKSYILSELMIFENISDIEKPFKNIDFYLDTQFVLRILGYTYPPLAKSCDELRELLFTECGNLYVFRHTLDEIVGILRACQTELYSSTPKLLTEVGHYCINNGISASDIEIIINSIEDLLKEKRIGVLDKPEHSEEFAIAESQLVDYLNTHYRYKNPRARDRDIDSIQAVYRLRKGKKPNSIRDCDCVFVTTNSVLAKHIYSFFFKEENYTHFPLLITDHLTTNLVWSRKTDKYENISRNQRLADAFALTNPSDVMWEKYYNEIQKLVSQNRLPEEEAMLFLYSSEVKGAIMDITRGGEIEPDESNIFDIITTAKERLTYEEKEEIKKLKNKLEEIQRIKQQSSNKDKEIAGLREEVNAQKSRQSETVLKIKKFALKTSQLIAWLIMVVPIAFIAVGILNFVIAPYKYIFSSVLAIFTFLNIYRGTNLLGVRRKLEIKINRKILQSFDIA